MNLVQSASDVYGQLGLLNGNEQSVPTNQLQMKDFLNLMITELTHQDPFKPMENSEMATQISQFATVSGIEQLNMSFADLRTSLTSDQALQAANLVGHDVMIEGNVGWLPSGDNLSGNIYLPDDATGIKIRITDSTGQLVREIDLGSHESGIVDFNWDGLNDAGDPMPEGAYIVTAEATIDDAEIAPSVLVQATVESVNLAGPGGIWLNLEGLGAISINDVMEIL